MTYGAQICLLPARLLPARLLPARLLPDAAPRLAAMVPCLAALKFPLPTSRRWQLRSPVSLMKTCVTVLVLVNQLQLALPARVPRVDSGVGNVSHSTPRTRKSKFASNQCDLLCLEVFLLANVSHAAAPCKCEVRALCCVDAFFSSCRYISFFLQMKHIMRQVYQLGFCMHYDCVSPVCAESTTTSRSRLPRRCRPRSRQVRLACARLLMRPLPSRTPPKLPPSPRDQTFPQAVAAALLPLVTVTMYRPTAPGTSNAAVHQTYPVCCSHYCLV